MHQLSLAARPPAPQSQCSRSRTACRCSLKQAPASLAVAARRCAAAPLLAASLLLAAAAASPGIPAGTPPGLPSLPLVSRDACSRLRSIACTVHTRCGKIYVEFCLSIDHMAFIRFLYFCAAFAQSQGAALFRKACIGCHDTGGNILQPVSLLKSLARSKRL